MHLVQKKIHRWSRIIYEKLITKRKKKTVFSDNH